jgi:hypothetical protein
MVVDFAAGTAEMVPLTPAEEADLVERDQQHTLDAERDERISDLLSGLTPPRGVVQKIAAGSSLSASELDGCVRYLIAKEFVQGVID